MSQRVKLLEPVGLNIDEFDGTKEQWNTICETAYKHLKNAVVEY